MQPDQDAYFWYDIDWFAADPDGYLVHFTSGGGRLPVSVVAVTEDERHYLCEYFESLPVLTTEVYPNEDDAHNSDHSDEYAARGLFSFDKTDLHSFIDMRYHLIAVPGRALRLADLPADVAASVARTRLPFSVIGLTSIDTSVIA